jgi:hypothetical protein
MGFAALTDGLGFSLAAMGAIGAGIAAVWAVTGLYLGRAFDRRGLQPESDVEGIPATAPAAVSPTRG